MASLWWKRGALGLLLLVLPWLASAQSTLTNGSIVVVETINYCTDVGSNDAYACSHPAEAQLTTYKVGHRQTFVAATANTGAATLALDGLSAIPLKVRAGSTKIDPPTGTICAGSKVEAVYDGTDFEIVSLPCSPVLTAGNATAVKTALSLENVNNTADTAKPVNLGTNAVTGTMAQFNTAVSDANLFPDSGSAGLPNRTSSTAATAITSSTVGAVLRVTGADAFGFGPLDLADTDAVTNVLPAANLPTASTGAAGVTTLATSAETTTGTNAVKAVTPDGLAGSDYGKRYLTLEVVADATALTTGDGKAYFPIHPDLAGWVVVGVSAHVGAVVSSSGAVNVDIDICGAVATGIRCSGTNRDLLSTNITIDANEDGTETAATPAVINTANDDLATGEWIRYNIDGAGTATQGLYVTLVLQKP